MKSRSLAGLGAAADGFNVNAASWGVAVGVGDVSGVAGVSWPTKPNGMSAQKRSVGIYRIGKKRKAAHLKIQQF
jgi:hypothetical protein